MCFFKHKKTKKNEPLSYEDLLLKQYGPCKVLNSNIKLLIFADTHNEFAYKENELISLLKLEYDACILLGDHSIREIELFCKYVPDGKLFGVLGNHDYINAYDNTKIVNLNGKMVNVKGINIAGIEGSVAYKQSQKAMHTQEESLEIIKNFMNVDVLISHDRPWLEQSFDPAHDGLKGITEAIFRNKVAYHFHGHLHENSCKILKNGTKSFCIYSTKLIEL